MQVRGELFAAIYRKALYLSNDSRQSIELGKIVNLMSADMNNIQLLFFPMFNLLVSAPVLIISSFVLLWQQIQWATFIGEFMLSWSGLWV